jgi:hypothetical protein
MLGERGTVAKNLPYGYALGGHAGKSFGEVGGLGLGEGSAMFDCWNWHACLTRVRWSNHSEGALSAAQLEAVVYAGQNHAKMRPDGTRRGFFVGDGTGVGKGRTIAAIVIDNILRDRPRHIWCTISNALRCGSAKSAWWLGEVDVRVHARQVRLPARPEGPRPA